MQQVHDAPREDTVPSAGEPAPTLAGSAFLPGVVEETDQDAAGTGVAAPPADSAMRNSVMRNDLVSMRGAVLASSPVGAANVSHPSVPSAGGAASDIAPLSGVVPLRGTFTMRGTLMHVFLKNF